MKLRLCLPLLFLAAWAVLIGQEDPQIQLREGEREVANGNYAAAVPHMNAALTIAGSVVSEPTLMRSVILRSAEIESLSGNFDEGEKIVRTLEQLGSSNTEETIRAQIVVARCERERGNLRAAGAAAGNAVNLAAAHPDVNSDWALNATAELAEVRRQEGNFAEAQRLSSRVVAGNSNSLQLSATALAAPARIARSVGRLTEARRLAESTLAVRSRVRPADHPDLLVLRELLARIAIDQGRLHDAAQILNGLSEAARLRLGAAHPFTVNSQLTEISYYIQHAAYQESETRLERAQVGAARLPLNNDARLRILELRVSVALGLHRSDDAATAVAQATQFVSVREGGDSPQMASVLNLQAAVAIDQGRLQDAERMLGNADAILASRSDETQPNRMDTRFYSGLLYQVQADTKRTDETLTKWIDLRGAEATDEPEIIALRILARSALSQKDFARSATLFSRALLIQDDIGGSSDKELSTDYYDMGAALKSSGRLPEAATAFRRSLELKERGGQAGTDSLSVYSSLADTLLTLGKTAEALPYLESRLRLLDRIDPDGSDDTLRLTDQVSRIQFSEGHYQDAEPLLRRLYDAALSGRGPAAQDRSDLLERLGEAETQLNRNDEAVRFLDELSRIDLLRKKFPEADEAAVRAVDAARRSLSPLNISSALNALADVRFAQSRFDDAAASYAQARSTEGADNRARAASLNGLGRIALNRKQWEEADKLLNDALETVQTSSNPSPGLEALVIANLAAAQIANDHPDRASELYVRFLELEPLSHPPEDPPLLEQLDELARFYSLKQGHTQDVLGIYNRVLRSSQLVFGDQSAEFAWALFNEAEFYRNQKQYNEATPLYERSARLFKVLYGEQSDQVQNVSGPLAEVYRAQGRTGDAIKLLEPLVQNSDNSNVFHGVLLEQLAGLYRESGNQVEAIRIYEGLASAYADQAPAHQNAKWLEAMKNLIGANVEAKRGKEASALLDKALAKVHSSARKDTMAEVNLLRSYSTVLRKDNRVKEADAIDGKAKRIEQSLGGH